MSRPGILHWLTKRTARKNRTANRRRRSRLYQPYLELLEGRTLLSTLNWINAAGGDWDTPSNWDAGRVPTLTDDAVINLTGITVTHSTTALDSVNNLTSLADLDISNGSLTVTSSNTGAIIVDAGTLAGGSITAPSLSVVKGDLLSLPSTITQMYQLDLNVTGTVLVDATSRIDVTGKGYLPGRTTGNTTVGGATSTAGAVMAGVLALDMTVVDPAASLNGDPWGFVDVTGPLDLQGSLAPTGGGLEQVSGALTSVLALSVSGATLAAESLIAPALTLANGAVLTSLTSTATAMHKLEVQVTGTLLVDAASRIDVSGKCYLAGQTTGTRPPEVRHRPPWQLR